MYKYIVLNFLLFFGESPAGNIFTKINGFLGDSSKLLLEIQLHLGFEILPLAKLDQNGNEWKSKKFSASWIPGKDILLMDVSWKIHNFQISQQIWICELILISIRFSFHREFLREFSLVGINCGVFCWKKHLKKLRKLKK